MKIKTKKLLKLNPKEHFKISAHLKRAFKELSDADTLIENNLKKLQPNSAYYQEFQDAFNYVDRSIMYLRDAQDFLDYVGETNESAE